MKNIILSILLLSGTACADTVWIPDVTNPSAPWKKFDNVKLEYWGDYVSFKTKDGRRIRSNRYVAQQYT